VRPGIAAACKIVAAIEQRDHVFLLERFIAHVVKVRWNARQTEIESVAPGDGIDAVEISDPLILDQRGDRTLGNRQHILPDRVPFRIDLSVSDNVYSRLRGGRSRLLIAGHGRKDRRSDKDLSGDAPIDMQLVAIRRPAVPLWVRPPS
jgi:hypothetical protein